MIGEGSVVELVMVVLGPIEELTIRRVHLAVILRILDVEVVDPAQLTVDVTFLG